jgi:hypothetical protein
MGHFDPSLQRWVIRGVKVRRLSETIGSPDRSAEHCRRKPASTRTNWAKEAKENAAGIARLAEDACKSADCQCCRWFDTPQRSDIKKAFQSKAIVYTASSLWCSLLADSVERSFWLRRKFLCGDVRETTSFHQNRPRTSVTLQGVAEEVQINFREVRLSNFATERRTNVRPKLRA